MPELCRFLGIIIHFHAIYNDLEGIFEFSTFQMLEGNLPARVKGLVIEWATLHKQELIDNWNSLTKTGMYKKNSSVGLNNAACDRRKIY